MANKKAPRASKLTEFEKQQLATTKRERRERDVWTDNLRNLGAARRGIKRDDKKIGDAIVELIPRLADLSCAPTYDELADLSGLSRARVGQILAKHRKENPPTPDATPDDADGLVAGVGAL